MALKGQQLCGVTKVAIEGFPALLSAREQCGAGDREGANFIILEKICYSAEEFAS